MGQDVYIQNTYVPNIYVYIYIYIYVCLVHTYSVYIYPAPFVRDEIFPCCTLVHCCSRDKTRRTEWLNSGDLNGDRGKGGTTSKTETDY